MLDYRNNYIYQTQIYLINKSTPKLYIHSMQTAKLSMQVSQQTWTLNSTKLHIVIKKYNNSMKLIAETAHPITKQ